MGLAQGGAQSSPAPLQAPCSPWRASSEMPSVMAWMLLEAVLAAALVVTAGADNTHRQPHELLGFFQGACVQQAAATRGPDGQVKLQCLPEGQLVSQPVSLLYTRDAHGKVTFEWWEDAVSTTLVNKTSSAAAASTGAGTAYELTGGHDRSLKLHAWRAPGGGGSTLCINATFAGFSVVYRAGLSAVGSDEGALMVEVGRYSLDPLALVDWCAPSDTLPLTCDDNSFTYKCVAFRSPWPAWLSQRDVLHTQAGAATEQRRRRRTLVAA